MMCGKSFDPIGRAKPHFDDNKAVAGMVTYANGTAEGRALENMLKAKSKAAGHRITAAEDKAYDTAGKQHGTMRKTKHRGIAWPPTSGSI
jgi:hypothetical protein